MLPKILNLPNPEIMQDNDRSSLKEYKTMKILVIGATGRTGKEIVDQALAKGYEVIAYVRRPEAVPKRKNLHVVGPLLLRKVLPQLLLDHLLPPVIIATFLSNLPIIISPYQ